MYVPSQRLYKKRAMQCVCGRPGCLEDLLPLRQPAQGAALVKRPGLVKAKAKRAAPATAPLVEKKRVVSAEAKGEAAAGLSPFGRFRRGAGVAE